MAFLVGFGFQVLLGISLIVIRVGNVPWLLAVQCRLPDIGQPVESVIVIAGGSSLVVLDLREITSQIVLHAHHVIEAIGGTVPSVEGVVCMRSWHPFPIGF